MVPYACSLVHLLALVSIPERFGVRDSQLGLPTTSVILNSHGIAQKHTKVDETWKSSSIGRERTQGAIITVKKVSLAELRQQKLSTPSIQDSVSVFEKAFPPRSARPRFCHQCREGDSLHSHGKRRWEHGRHDNSSALFEFARVNANRTDGIADLPRALAEAMVPTPGAGACLEVGVDLAALGYPGLSVTLGIDGKLDYDVACTKCFQWDFRTALAFQAGISVMGYGLIFEVKLTGQVNIKEIKCEDAAEAAFCRFIHLFVPVETNRQNQRTSRCHSDSPFEVIMAYLKYQWNQIRHHNGAMENLTTDVEVELATMKQGMNKYPPLFEFAPEPLAESDIRAAENLLHEPKVWHIEQFESSWKFWANRKYYAWVLSSARRLCLSPYPKKPPDAALNENNIEAGILHQYCPRTIRLDEIRSVSSRDGTIMLQASHGRKLRMQRSKKKADVTRWQQALSNLVERSPPRTDAPLFAKCLSAALHPDSAHVPYCVLENPMQLWASSYELLHMKNKEIVWNEGAAFRSRPIVDMTVLVVDRVDEKTQARARLRVCMNGTNAQEDSWSVISSTHACEDQIGRIGFTRSARDLQDCQTQCSSIPGCSAIDFYSRTHWCNFFDHACEHPTRSKDGSQSYKLTVRSCHVTVTIGSKINVTRPLFSFTKESSLFASEGHVVARAGQASVELAAQPPPRPSGKRRERLPMMRLEAQALFAALQQWMGKIPGYANRVRDRIQGINGEDTEDGVDVGWTSTGSTIAYERLRGRFFARWRADKGTRAMDLFERGDRKKPEEERVQKQQRVQCRRNGGVRDSIACQLERLREVGHGGLQWYERLQNAFQEMIDKRPCVSSALSGRSWDDRVINFARAQNESRYAHHPAHRLSFSAELATSAANLFVRAVADVHALFSIYFADDAAWDDDCSSLKVKFSLPFEFGDDPEDPPGFRWKPPRTKPPVEDHRYISRRASRTVGRAGRSMKSRTNPFCWWPWASGLTGQEERADFVGMDPPIGGADGFQTMPREQSAIIHPHIWCNLVKGMRAEALHRKEERGSGTNKTDPIWLESRHVNGMALKYKAACQQLLVQEDGHQRTWRRYDCEMALLSSSFLSFFPAFSETVRRHFERVAQPLEDVLQCTGRITKTMRQYPAKGTIPQCDGSDDFRALVQEPANLSADGRDVWSIISDEAACEKNDEGISRSDFKMNTRSLEDCKRLCEEKESCVAIDYFHQSSWCNFFTRPCRAPKGRWSQASSHKVNKGQGNISKAHAKLVAFVQQRTQDVLRYLAEFLEHVASADVRQSLALDFHDNFGFQDLGHQQGVAFTGKMWQDGLRYTIERLGSVEGIGSYLGQMQDHIVMKAWRMREYEGMHAVFPPPAAYSSTISIGVGLTNSKALFCSAERSKGTELSVSWRSTGKTWVSEPGSPYDVSGGFPCISMRFLISEKLMITPSLCINWRRDALKGNEYSWEFIWRLEASSIVSTAEVDAKQKIYDWLDDLQATLANSITSEGSQIEGDELSGIMENPAWALTKSTLSDPQLYFEVAKGVVLGEGVGGSGAELWNAGKALVDRLWSKGRELMGRLKDAIVVKITDVAGALKTFLESLPPWDLTTARHNIVTASIELSRLGEGSWVKQFKLYYLRRYEVNAAVSLDVPGAVSVRTKMFVQARFDLSEVFDVIFAFDNKEKAEGAYGCCVRCLSDAGTAFCGFVAPSQQFSGPRMVQCLRTDVKLLPRQTLVEALDCPGNLATDISDCEAVVKENEETEFSLPPGGCRNPGKKDITL